MWFIGVEVEQETCAPPPKKDPGSAPALNLFSFFRKELFFAHVISNTKFNKK